MEPPPIIDLALFMGLVLALSLFGLTASGHFPREFRPASLQSDFGAVVLWGSLAIAAALAAIAATLAWQRLPLYAIIIGGGVMVLFAPLLLRPFPDSLVNGRAGLILFVAIALALGLIAAHRLVAT
jgi:hypothetical protein